MIKQFFIYAFCIAILTSCSKDFENINGTGNQETNQELISLGIKIDSISESYSKIYTTDNTRGLCSDYAVTTAADAVGAVIGKKLFSWVGASIGAACGNPVVAAGGYLVGRNVGKVAGQAVASIGAAWVLNKYHSRSISSPSLKLNHNYAVPINDVNNITDGELHNLIVADLLKDFDHYITFSGELNFNLLIEDALDYEQKYCPSEEYSQSFKELWLPKAEEQTKRIVNSSYLLGLNDNNDFLEDVYKSLIPEIQISKSDFENSTLLIKKSLSTYMELDDKNIHNYSNDLEKIIDQSKLDTQLKDDLTKSNSVIMNSTLIWREVK